MGCGHLLRHIVAFLDGQLFLTDLVGQLVDRSGELERQLVAIIHRRAGIGVHARASLQLRQIATA